MIKSEHIAKKICQEIKVWKKDRAKLIVAIDGYAGSGKTTIGNFIAKHDADVLTIHLDDFINHWKVRKQMILEAKDKSKVFEYHWYRYNDLERLIKVFLSGKKSTKLKTYNYNKNDFGPKQTFDLSKKVLIIDGVFLLHPKHAITKLIHKNIYLDIDFAKADRKRIAREKKRWGNKYIPEDHPDSWFKYFKSAYLKYIHTYKPKKIADSVFKV
jgi:uridine kinase